MPDWQSGMDWMMRDSEAKGQRSASWQRVYRDALSRGMSKEEAAAAADRFEQRLGTTPGGGAEWEVRFGIPGTPGGPPGSAPGGGAMGMNYQPGSGPPGATQPSGFRPPSALPGPAAPGGVPGLPGGNVSFANPTPPALSGDFNPPGKSSPYPSLGSLVTGGAGSGFGASPMGASSPMGGLRDEKAGSGGGSKAPWWVEPLVGAAGVGANIYGASQEGKARSEELEQRRQEHAAELEEQKKRREQERIDMILRAISSTI